MSRWLSCRHESKQLIRSLGGDVIAWSCNTCPATGNSGPVQDPEPAPLRRRGRPRKLPPLTSTPAAPVRPSTPLVPPSLDCECECGQPKINGSVACDNCQFLDGGGMTNVIISAMRQVDNGEGVTIYDLIDVTGRSHRSVQRSLQRLRDQRRAVRRMPHGEDAERDSAGATKAIYYLSDGRDEQH